MKTVGVKEFRDSATKLLASGETMLIGRRGHPVGHFIPVKKKASKAAKEAMERLEEAALKLEQESTLSEDELADLFPIKRD